MLTKKTWKEFRESGLLWWINMILHTFGWCIVCEEDENENITNIYPAKTNFRGFSNEKNDIGYKKVNKFMKENAEKIFKDGWE